MEYDYAKDARIVGQISAYAGTAIPPNHLLCNGAAVVRKTHPILFQNIGTTFGVGDGSTTFNIPTIANLATNVKYIIRCG